MYGNDENEGGRFKSAMCLSIMQQAMLEGKKVFFFSLEASIDKTFLDACNIPSNQVYLPDC